MVGSPAGGQRDSLRCDPKDFLLRAVDFMKSVRKTNELANNNPDTDIVRQWIDRIKRKHTARDY